MDCKATVNIGEYSRGGKTRADIVILFDNGIYQRQEIKPISVWSVY